MFTKKIFSLLAVLFGMAMSFVAYAQTVKVSGTVSDKQGPLGAVVVFVPGSTENTMTDMDGKYTITVPTKATLEFSCMGYATVQEKVNGRKNIDVVLVADNVLEDAVVLGYGAASAKKDLSTAVGVVANVDQLNVRPVSSAEGMLQGQIAGVVVSADGGSPTDAPKVVIRGQGSQNGDSVLWVVDGIPGAPFSMSDVESIVVLKDAASAAIYGAQSGAGGVILVTTKKSGGTGISLSYDGVYGVRKASNLPQQCNAEEEILMRKISHENAGLTIPPAWDPEVNPWVGKTRTDWVNMIFRSAVYQRHSFALNYNTDKVRSRLSVSMDSDEGVLVGTFNKKFHARYVGDFRINKYITIKEDMQLTTNSGRSANTSSGYSGAIVSALYMPASAQAYRADGTFGGTTTEDPDYEQLFGSNFSSAHGDSINPLRELLAQDKVDENQNIWTTTTLEINDVIKGLRFSTRYTVNISQNFSKSFTPKRTEVGKPDMGSSLNYGSGKSISNKTESTLSYNRKFGKHTIDLLASMTTEKWKNDGVYVNGSAFEEEELWLQYVQYTTNPSSIQAGYYVSSSDASFGLVARGAYSYADRYFFTASWRRDYAARLPKEKYGDFPAFTGAWKISSEPFFPKSNVLTHLKLRASWGRVGNLGSVGGSYRYDSISAGSNSSDVGGWGAEKNINYGYYTYYSRMINQKLTWETSEQTDLGLDMEWFKGHLGLEFDVYDKRTFNLIQGQTMYWPSSTGLDAMLVNQGEIRNRGFEASVKWDGSIGKLSYYINGNYSYNKNWVSDIGVYALDPVSGEMTKGVWTGGGEFRNIPNFYQTCEGGPLNQYYMIECTGLFRSWDEVYQHVDKEGKLIQPNAQPGDLRFVDFNEDGKINDADRQYFGCATPPHTFALTLGASWKNLSGSVMLQGVYGAQAAFVGKYSLYSDVDGNFNRDRRVLGAWSEENPDSNIPRLSRSDLNGNFGTASTWYLEDTSYLRIKSFNITYDFTSLLRKVKHFERRHTRLSVFFTGENLFTFTKYTGMDPECGGYDPLKYPVSRTLSGGVRLSY